MLRREHNKQVAAFREVPDTDPDTVSYNIYLCDLSFANTKDWAVLVYVYALYEGKGLYKYSDPQIFARRLRSGSAAYGKQHRQERFVITESTVQVGGCIYFLLCEKQGNDLVQVGRYYVRQEDFYLHETFRTLRKVLGQFCQQGAPISGFNPTGLPA